MADDTYYTLVNVKQFLGETGDTNNTKISRYGDQADNKINIELTQLEEPLPVTTSTEGGAEKLLKLKPIADKMTAALFYKYESGSDDLLEEAMIDLSNFIFNTYRRPSFQTIGAA